MKSVNFLLNHNNRTATFIIISHVYLSYHTITYHITRLQSIILHDYLSYHTFTVYHITRFILFSLLI